MRIVSGVQFADEDTIIVTYMDPASDVRNRGLLVRSYQIQITRGQDGKDYGDEFDAVNLAILRLLKDALEDFEVTPAVSPAELGDANARSREIEDD